MVAEQVPSKLCEPRNRKSTKNQNDIAYFSGQLPMTINLHSFVKRKGEKIKLNEEAGETKKFCTRERGIVEYNCFRYAYE